MFNLPESIWWLLGIVAAIWIITGLFGCAAMQSDRAVTGGAVHVNEPRGVVDKDIPVLRLTTFEHCEHQTRPSATYKFIEEYSPSGVTQAVADVFTQPERIVSDVTDGDRHETNATLQLDNPNDTQVNTVLEQWPDVVSSVQSTDGCDVMSSAKSSRE